MINSYHQNLNFWLTKSFVTYLLVAISSYANASNKTTSILSSNYIASCSVDHGCIYDQQQPASSTIWESTDYKYFHKGFYQNLRSSSNNDLESKVSVTISVDDQQLPNQVPLEFPIVTAHLIIHF